MAKHDQFHDDRRHPAQISANVFQGVVIGVVMGLVTTVGVSYTMIQVLDAKMDAYNFRLTKVEILAEATRSEQDKRKWIVDGARRILERNK